MNRLQLNLFLCAAVFAAQLATAQDTDSERVRSYAGPKPDEKFCKHTPYPNCVPTYCLPCLCLQKNSWQAEQPDNYKPAGAFTLKGLVSGKGIFTWKGACYTAQMRYAGADDAFWYYKALCTPFCFAIAKEQDDYYKDHKMYIYDCRGGGFEDYQYALAYPCPKPTTPYYCHKPAPCCYHAHYHCPPPCRAKSCCPPRCRKARLCRW